MFNASTCPIKVNRKSRDLHRLRLYEISASDISTMKVTLIVTLLSAFALPVFADSVFVVQNANYTNPNASLSTVTCSRLSLRYANFSSLPSFPNIGGIPGVVSNSTLCGSCWSLTPAPPCSGLNTLYFTVIDNDSSFVVDTGKDVNATVYAISPQAYGNLTHASCNVNAVYAEAAQVQASMCGM
ncbi:uncharacterized protein F5891DRAFT_1050005 [Suillus fuscotomentosus]|uniref:Cerato-platanin n=1 Tax=Suillus fuscotomentosus TaxID=1912939 RepID=A0AAD4E097_9AGAM|nr:uncharacterized protein F5891DRAFT_1050005 [Suillus fuscotomentosus]KAG1897247.1 hypothetical protein F5891DRAFT_1050005 [Suillus fuscotomentosus]